MWRMGLDTVGIGIVLIMLLTLAFAVLISQQQRSQKTVGVWLGSLLVGLLLGSALTLGAIRYFDPNVLEEVLAGPSGGSGAPAGPGGGQGMLAGPIGGREPEGGPNPKHDLTVLVCKLDLLTSDIGITMTAEQAALAIAALTDIEKMEKMTEEEAQAKRDALLAVLDDEQKSALDMIGLPRPQGGAGGPGGPPRSADANPFEQEANAKTLESLRQRIAPADLQ